MPVSTKCQILYTMIPNLEPILRELKLECGTNSHQIPSTIQASDTITPWRSGLYLWIIQEAEG